MQKIFPAAMPKPVPGLALLVLLVHLGLLWLAPPLTTAPTSPRWAGPLIMRPLSSAPSIASVAKPPAQPAPRKPPKVSSTPAPAASPAVAAPTASGLSLLPQEVASPPAPASATATNTPLAPLEPETPSSTASPAPLPEPEPAPVASAAIPVGAAVLAVPGSTRLKYEVAGTVRSINYHASGELLWRHDGSQYDARLEIGAFLLGTRAQTSRGQITEQGLKPKRFSDKVRSEVAAHFVWDKDKIIFSANVPQAPLQAGAQDHLSVFIQLASLFASQPGLTTSGSELEFQAVGAREVNTWRFVVNGFQRLQLPGGALDTLKLTRLPAQTYDLKAELWLAPALGWLPARIRLSQDNGDFVDQQWSETQAP